MIIKYSLQNFGPIKDMQTLSFEANNSEHLKDHYIVEIGKHRLLKLALIYGANASGKTTILKGLEFLRELVLDPNEKKTEELNFLPFLFDETSRDESSKMSIEFIQNEIKYSYEVEFTIDAIISERLDFYSPNKANVFTRTTNLNNQFAEISLGSKIKKDKTFIKSLESNTLWNNTVLGGYLKTNIAFEELNDVIIWFSDHLMALVYTDTKLEGYITKKIEDDEIDKRDIINILKKADFNISDILIQQNDEEFEKGFIKFLNNKLNVPESSIEKLKASGTFKSLDIDFEHTINGLTYSIPFKQESEGTKRYYGFSGLLAMLIKDQKIIPLDELEASLHPDLYIQFLLSFLVNSENSQIIATTHNREILNDRNTFRKDIIWFTDKSKDSTTELYSLAHFDSSDIRKDTNVLNAYKNGRLGGNPILGDYYIDLEE